MKLLALNHDAEIAECNQIVTPRFHKGDSQPVELIPLRHSGFAGILKCCLPTARLIVEFRNLVRQSPKDGPTASATLRPGLIAALNGLTFYAA